MSKARIFISHSCKDVEIADGPAFELEPDPRLRRLKYAKYVRDRVVDLLAAKGFEVLLDRALLDPGDRWPIKLLRWLGDCDGAVLLLSEDAIASHWVLQEATVLTWRRRLRDSFRLIPVMLGDLPEVRLATAGFGPLQIGDIQAARIEASAQFLQSEADALAKRVAERFEDLAAGSADNEMRAWLTSVADILGLLEDGTQGDDILAQACAPLRISSDDWSHFTDHARTVAHYLIHADLSAASKTLAELAKALQVRSDRAFPMLVEMVLPLWVDRAAAAALAEAGEGPRHLYALNSDDPDIADDYVRRAWCCPAWLPNRSLHFDEPMGEGQEQEALARLRSSVASMLRVPRAYLDLLPERLRDRPFLILFGSAATMSRELRDGLATDAALKHATGIVLAGRDFAHLAADAGDIPRLRPVLDTAHERAAFLGKSSILDLLPPGATPAPGSPHGAP